MPRKYLMTWEAGKCRWRKMYRGQVYTVSCATLGVPASKDDSWQVANAWWRTTLMQLGPAALPVPALDEVSSHLARLLSAVPAERLMSLVRQGQAAAQLTEILNAASVDDSTPVEQRLAEGRSLPSKVPAILLGTPGQPLTAEETQSRLSDLASTISGKPVEPDRSILALTEKWKALQKCGNNRRLTLARTLAFFTAFIGDADVSTVNETTWENFYLHLKSLKHDDGYKKLILTTAKRFVHYLYAKGVLPTLPRNLDSNLLAFEQPVKKVKPLTAETVRRFYAQTRDQTRLHTLLMLNCGMLAKDVSDLQDDEVDWHKGTVTRKRSKTQKHKDVPIVTFQLWPTTYALLKEYRSGGPTTLLQPDGRRWITEVEGKNRVDAIAKRFKSAAGRAGVKVSPKDLRTTAASMLAGHPQYKFYAQYFLGQAAENVADRHYVVPSDAEFFEALAWLDEQFGLKVESAPAGQGRQVLRG